MVSKNFPGVPVGEKSFFLRPLLLEVFKYILALETMTENLLVEASRCTCVHFNLSTKKINPSPVFTHGLIARLLKDACFRR
jgi:hypothetical protein